MDFSKTKPRNRGHQFLEVDEDLRRIAEREAAKPFCPFGKNCYRKNPNHLQEYKHQSPSGSPKKAKTIDKNTLKRGKITDFFRQKPTSPKKLPIESSVCDKRPNDYEIEDDSEDEVTDRSFETKDKPKASHPKESTPKHKNKTSKTKTDSNRKKRSKNCNSSDEDFGNDFKSLLNEKNPLLDLKPKPLNINPKKNICSPKVRKLNIIEDTVPEDVSKASKTTSELKEDKQKPNISDKSDEKVWKTSPINSNNSKMTSKEWNQMIKEIFLVEMPKDFFQLWHFCKTIQMEKPEEALLQTLGLRLVGPYDILSAKINKNCIKDNEAILCHFRYFYDLPEFQTTIASNKSGYHLGYFRDTPEEDNPVVVSNSGDKTCVIEGVADNMLAALYSEIQKQKTRDSSNLGLKQLETKLKGFCDINEIDLKANSKLKSRKTKTNAKTFNNFGFIVPYNKKTEVGYRPLPLTDSELKKLLNAILKVDSEARDECKSLLDLQEIIQLISYANDECDFGMGLELGIDLFCSGDPFFHKSALHLLSMAYDLLKREAFSRIIKAHLHYRRKGFNLSSI